MPTLHTESADEADAIGDQVFESGAPAGEPIEYGLEVPDYAVAPGWAACVVLHT